MFFLTVINRREREHGIRREMIVTAAQKLFEKKGFELTTVDEIAAEAELGKGTIYSYFKSKSAIYVAILEKGSEVLRERMKKVVKEERPAIDTLYCLYDTFIQFHRERKNFIETLFIQVDQQNLIRLGNMALGLKNRSSEWLEIVGGVLQNGMNDGEFITFDVNKMAKAIIGMIFGIIMQDDMGKIDEDLGKYRQTVFQLAMKGICK
jgi:AcrR family transcriptional regulator